MITEPPFTASILENLFILIVTSLPVMGSKIHLPLRINMLHIPTPVVTGDNVLLRCGYELGNETLYAVKWYKNMGEFFRYVPASDPPLKVFPQVGIDVDMSKSDKSTVYLRNLSLESFGNYTCQVSTDKPFFRCVQTTKQLEVVVPPSDGPVLMEEKSDYELGDNVSILCNSGKSKPAPELKWYINDQLAHSELSDQETIVYPDQLESTSLALRFRLKPEVLHDGKVTLKCVATINHMHAVTIKEIRAAGSHPQMTEWLLWIIIAITLS
ncbi:endothelial cell-selective adhesion molecule-like [Uloborus diversus]|uniref:endothelial cell-selective adhesion molecule-like n=1 Tax=Uloborus diversus TaxID=327109 RepID=UPI00240A0613|nr:endothelial cell-selective adhesion molecule-like [Uloborus diversus]